MSNNLNAINGDKRDHAFTIRMQAIYKNCLIGPLKGCRDQFMNTDEIRRGFASNDHCIDLPFPPISDVGHSLLIVRTIGKSDRTEAPSLVEASCALVCLEAPQFECVDPTDLCCID